LLRQQSSNQYLHRPWQGGVGPGPDDLGPENGRDADPQGRWLQQRATTLTEFPEHHLPDLRGMLRIVQLPAASLSHDAEQLLIIAVTMPTVEVMMPRASSSPA
jgi:hypothetical protein